MRRRQLVGERRVEDEPLLGNDRARHGDDDAFRADRAAICFYRQHRATMIDARRLRAVRDRKPVGERLEQPAIAAREAPIDAAVFVTVVVLGRYLIELDGIAPGARRVQERVPPPAGRERGRAGRILRELREAVHRPVEGLALGDPISLGL